MLWSIILFLVRKVNTDISIFMISVMVLSTPIAENNSKHFYNGYLS
jgi:hypothetical protein